LRELGEVSFVLGFQLNLQLYYYFIFLDSPCKDSIVDASFDLISKVNMLITQGGALAMLLGVLDDHVPF